MVTSLGRQWQWAFRWWRAAMGDGKRRKMVADDGGWRCGSVGDGEEDGQAVGTMERVVDLVEWRAWVGLRPWKRCGRRWVAGELGGNGGGGHGGVSQVGREVEDGWRLLGTLGGRRSVAWRRCDRGRGRWPAALMGLPALDGRRWRRATVGGARRWSSGQCPWWLKRGGEAAAMADDSAALEDSMARDGLMGEVEMEAETWQWWLWASGGIHGVTGAMKRRRQADGGRRKWRMRAVVEAGTSKGEDGTGRKEENVPVHSMGAVDRYSKKYAAPKSVQLQKMY